MNHYNNYKSSVTLQQYLDQDKMSKVCNVTYIKMIFYDYLLIPQLFS